jgi:hypothetical protein
LARCPIPSPSVKTTAVSTFRPRNLDGGIGAFFNLISCVASGGSYTGFKTDQCDYANGWGAAIGNFFANLFGSDGNNSNSSTDGPETVTADTTYANGTTATASITIAADGSGGTAWYTVYPPCDLSSGGGGGSLGQSFTPDGGINPGSTGDLSNPCPAATTTWVTFPIPPDPPVIRTDSLTIHFPCATSLIVNQLATIANYSTWIAPFTTIKKPDLIWQNGSLPWNAPIPNSTLTSYQLGSTAYFGRSATITLNTNMLQNSSQLLIAAAAIHETLHAYLNYNVQTAVGGFPQPQGYNPAGPWLYALDTWALVNGLPGNYADHYQMLNDYFTQAVAILAAWDNNAHTTKVYAEAMLYGLGNGTDGTPAQQALLQTEYNSLLTQYGITAANLNDFNLNNLNSTLNKLPTTGC